MMIDALRAQRERAGQIVDAHRREAMLLSGVASFAALQYALREQRAAWFLIKCGIGALLGVIFVTTLSTLVERRLDTARQAAVAATVGGVVGAGITILGISLRSMVFSTGGTGVVIVAVVVLTNGWKSEGRAHPARWILVGAVALAVALWILSVESPVRLVIGGLLAGVAIASLKIGLAGWCTRREASGVHVEAMRAWVTGAGGLAATVAAVVIAVVATTSASIAPALVLGYAGLSMIGLAATVLVSARPGKPRRQVLTGIVGLGLVIAGFLLLRDLFPQWAALVLLLGGAMVLIGAFFVLRGEAIVGLVLLGVVLGWVMYDRTENWEEPDEPGGLILTLGDSFAAGQGTGSFLSGTNTVDKTGNMCRRSVRSFSFLVARELNYDIESYACSGADIHEVASESRRDDAQERDDNQDGVDEETDPASAIAGPPEVQLDSANNAAYGLGDREPDLVLAALGINDASFSKLLTGCVLPTDCESYYKPFIEQAEGIESDLAEAYRRIQTRFPEARVIAIQYPPYIGWDDDCGGSLTDRERAFANHYARTVNESISAAAEQVDGVEVFDEIDRAFVRHTLCSPSSGANFAQILPNDGPLPKALIPSGWFNGSGHPNDLGHRCVAESLLRFLIEEQIVAAPPAVRNVLCELADVDEVADANARIDRLIDMYYPPDDPAEIESDWTAKSWRNEELQKSAPDGLLAAGLMVFGGGLLALAVVRSLDVVSMQAFKPDWM